MGRFLVMRMVGLVRNGLCGSQPADGKDADDEKARQEYLDRTMLHTPLFYTLAGPAARWYWSRPERVKVVSPSFFCLLDRIRPSFPVYCLVIYTWYGCISHPLFS